MTLLYSYSLNIVASVFVLITTLNILNITYFSPTFDPNYKRMRFPWSIWSNKGSPHLKFIHCPPPLVVISACLFYTDYAEWTERFRESAQYSTNAISTHGKWTTLHIVFAFSYLCGMLSWSDWCGNDKGWCFEQMWLILVQVTTGNILTWVSNHVLHSTTCSSIIPFPSHFYDIVHNLLASIFYWKCILYYLLYVPLIESHTYFL